MIIDSTTLAYLEGRTVARVEIEMTDDESEMYSVCLHFADGSLIEFVGVDNEVGFAFDDPSFDDDR